jgi:transcriptional regulator with XRE-family HTH domain
MEPISNADATLILQKTLGQRIQIARKAKGLSPAELAAMCGLHSSHICKMERGGANATLSTLLALAASLGIPLYDLFRDIRVCDFSHDQRAAVQPPAEHQHFDSHSS